MVDDGRSQRSTAQPGREPERFADRIEAGVRLAALLDGMKLDRPIVLALPRGGVPVAAVVARRIGAPLDVWVARKVGAPGHEEYGIGAIAEGGGEVFDDRALDILRVGDDQLRQLVDAQRQELDRRIATYRRNRPRADVAGRDVIVVDDGLATGVTAEAAVLGILEQAPRRVVLAVPVAAADSLERLSALVDVVAVITPDDFVAVGRWYRDFSETRDDDVVRLLDAHDAHDAGTERL